MIVSPKEKDIYAEALEKFQCERNREAEEAFARTFSESYDVRLFFINENKAYTDGKNIVVDPAFRDIYKDSECLEKIEELLDWPQLVSKSPWNSLKMVTRGQTLHESLHLIYSNLPGNEYKDAEFTGFKNGLKVMASISNIIEDAYIEAVGASVYDNISLYLLFNRLALVLAKKQTAGTSQQRFETAKPDALKGYNPPKDKISCLMKEGSCGNYIRNMYSFRKSFNGSLLILITWYPFSCIPCLRRENLMKALQSMLKRQNSFF